MAERLGISRTPVREALARLQAEGLVTTVGGRSPIVCQLSLQDYIEILKVRKMLEIEAAGLAAEIGLQDAVAEDVRAEIFAFRELDDPTAAQHWMVDDLVHGTIADAAQNKFLATTIRDLRRRTHIFDTKRIPERRLPGAQEHLDILDAVVGRDKELAQKLMAIHLDNIRTAIVDRIIGRVYKA